MRGYLIYIVLCVVGMLLVLFEPLSSDWLRFDREKIAGGEIWRLFTANYVHLSHTHALGNGLGVLLLAYIAGSAFNSKPGVILLIWSSLAVGGGLYLFADYLYFYVGFSGVLHALLLVAPFMSKAYSLKVASLFFIIIVIKVMWEQSPFYNDMALFQSIGGRVETNAHALGLIAGVCFLIVYYRNSLLKYLNRAN